MGQKLSLWHGPQYIIAEMDTKVNKTRRPSSSPQHGNRSRSSSLVTNNTTTNTSAASSVASSTTNLANLTTHDLENHDHHHHQSPILTSPSKYTPSPWAHAKIVATIPSRWPLSLCYMHTFSITQNYFVLIEQPLSLFLPTVPFTQISGSKPLASCLKFYKDEDTLFHVISRHGKKGFVNTTKSHAGGGSKSRKTFRSNSFFYLHTINAYEMRDGESRDTLLVVDICQYNDPSMIDCMYVDALKVEKNNINR
jgi:hypothetical protein